MPPRKVLYISPNGFLGGAERIVLNLATGHLKGTNIKPIILFFSEGEALDEAERNNIDCIVLESKFKLTQPIKLLNALIEIRRILKKHQIDIIHSTMAYSHLVTSIASLGLNLKKTWFQHGPVGGLLDKIASLFNTDYLFFNSSFLKNLHHSSFPHSNIKREEIIIRPGVFIQHTEAHRFMGDTIVFGTAGRITRGKSYDVIIKALIGAKKPFKLLIAGSPKSGLDEEYLQELICLKKLLLPGMTLEFIGHQSNMHDFYEKIDVFVHASQTEEPFGLVVAEAMGHGCLTIGRNDGGTKDFLIHQKTGLSYGSEQELGFYLYQLITHQDPDNINKLITNGKKLIASDYSIEQMIESIEKCYLSL